MFVFDGNIIRFIGIRFESSKEKGECCQQICESRKKLNLTLML